MTRLALAAVVIAASSSSAAAGTYVGLGIGTASNGDAELSSGTLTMDGYQRSGRLLVGRQFHKYVSVEAQGSRYDVSFDANPYQSTQLGLGVKGSLPIGNGFELLGRAGLERTWLSQGPTAMHDAAGNGWFIGLGVEYRIDLRFTGASLFMDYQRASTGFHNDYMLEWDGTASMWTMGATISF